VGAFAGLTRVSRQICEEYQAIQCREAKVDVDFEELPAYMPTFHSRLENPEIMPRKLLITLQPIADREEEQYEGVDLRRLLLL
jgi:hypothetical protein